MCTNNILTPRMVDISRSKNIELMTYSDSCLFSRRIKENAKRILDLPNFFYLDFFLLFHRSPLNGVISSKLQLNRAELMITQQKLKL